MGNADYVAAFLHVLLPVAFEVTAWGAGVVLMAGEGEGDPLSRVPPPHHSRMEPSGWGVLSGGASFTPAPVSFLPIPAWPRPQFDPELVLISAGFDSAIGDPEVRAWPGRAGLPGSQGQAPITLGSGSRGRCGPRRSASPTSRSCCRCWPAAESVLCWR